MGHHIATLAPKLISAIKNDDNDVKIVYKRLSTGKVEKFEVINQIGFWFQQILSFSTGCLACSLHDLAAGSSLHNLQGIDHSLCTVCIHSLRGTSLSA